MIKKYTAVVVETMVVMMIIVDADVILENEGIINITLEDGQEIECAIIWG